MNKGFSVPQPRCSKKGQSFVELALLFPAFLLLVLGVVDLGYVLYLSSFANRLSREGANLAARVLGRDQLTQVIDVLDDIAKPTLAPSARRKIIVSRLKAKVIGNEVKAEIEDRRESGAATDLPSRFGQVGGLLDDATMRSKFNGEILRNEEEVIVVEVLYKQKAITPLRFLWFGGAFGEDIRLYSVATFFLVARASPFAPL
ncbi:MAG: pilus assembly protein [Acidobacteria bacterium]|nr:pilus assembly protein [Acidobacteriota bacterium]MBI3657963.1 pilus assembly protein [Acidobacteriota bacterium]